MRTPALLATLALSVASSCQRTAAPPAVSATTDAGAGPRSAPPTLAPLAAGGAGRIEGVVSLAGTLPPQPPLETNASAARGCGASVPDRSLVVSAEGALAFAVVSWDGAPNAVPPFPAAVIDQKGCAYEPPVVAAVAGGTLTVGNSDALLHNVRANQGRGSLFNFAMPIAGMTVKKPLPETPGTVTLRCDVHPWMRAHVRTFSHTFFAVTDERGRFSLDGLPPGPQTLSLWHPRLPERRVSVDVQPEGTTTVAAHWSVEELTPRPQER